MAELLAKLYIEPSWQGTLEIRLHASGDVGGSLSCARTGAPYQPYDEKPANEKRQGHWKITLSSREMDGLRRRLESTRVPLSSGSILGCDGTTYRLEVGSGANRAKYTWWNTVPEGYEPLVEIARELVRLSAVRDREPGFCA